MADSTRPTEELIGWKAIAGHLAVSVRTAQTLEKEQGLPVRRRGGIKAPVYASTTELDAWRAGNKANSAASEETTQITTVEPTPDVPDGLLPNQSSPIEVTLGRRKWLRLAALGGIGLGGLVLGSLKLLSKGKLPPADYRIKGNTLTVLAEDESILWQHVFKLPIMANLADSMPIPRKPCIFADLNGDGHIETLFYYHTAAAESHATLVCLDDRGNQLWEFVAGKTVYSSQGWEFTPPYSVMAFAVMRVPGSAGAQIVVTSNHHYSYPDQVALLDCKTGRLISDYWHRGHLRHIALFDLDLDGERQPAVVFGGVNDAKEYKRATLVVFDPRNLSGCSQDPQGQPYFRGLGSGTEKAEVFLPRTPLSLGKEFNLVIDIVVMGERLAATVVEDVGEFGAKDYVIYEFDHALRPTNVILANDTMSHYNALQDPSKESADALARRLQSEVKVVRR